MTGKIHRVGKLTMISKYIREKRPNSPLLLIIKFLTLSFFFYTQNVLAGNEPNTVKIGYLPDQSSVQLDSRYKRLAVYLSEQTGLSISLTPVSSYDDLVYKIISREVDFANFGAYTFLKAENSNAASALVMRNTDLEFTSTFLIKNSLQATKLSETASLTFSFGNRLSTSGHLMPRYFMKQLGIEPEWFYSDILYSQTHDQAAKSIEKGLAEIAVLNSQIATNMFNNNDLDRSKVRILWVSPPYVDYVWAIHPDIDDTIKELLLDAFLNLDAATSEHKRILSALGADFYVPAISADFEIIREIAFEMKLLSKQP